MITLGCRPSFTLSEEGREGGRKSGEEGGKIRLKEGEGWEGRRDLKGNRGNEGHLSSYTHTPASIHSPQTHIYIGKQVIVCVPFDRGIEPLDHCHQPQSMPDVYYMISII